MTKAAKNRILFVLGDGVYPYRTGGMEIFNYYLIESLSKSFSVSYFANKPMNVAQATWGESYGLKPSKILFPLQLFIYCLFHRVDNVVFSFSSAHWIVWYLYTLIVRGLHLNSIAVIHYGDSTPLNHKRQYKSFFKAQKAVVAVSEDIKRNYDKEYQMDCKVIYPLVPFKEMTSSKEVLRKKYDVPVDVNVICMVGSLKKMKNPDTLLSAIANFSKEQLEKYKPFAVFAGDGNMKEELAIIAKENNIENRVRFLGSIPKETVNEIFALSDIYLIASDFEGTSVSLLEAMFNKMPIVISKAHGLVDMIEDEVDGLAFEMRNNDALKECIMRYLDDESLRSRLSGSAYRKYCRKYSYSDVVSSYKDLLSK